MALTGPEGETHSYIAPQDRERLARALAKDGQLTGDPLPDRGHWVGPRVPEPHNPGRMPDFNADGSVKPDARTAAEEWANRNGLPLDPPVRSAQKPAYRESPEELERRVDVLEKAVIRLQSVVIDLQHRVFELRK